AIGRSLGPNEFGVWYLVSTIATFAYVFVDWGYGPYLIGEISRRPDRAGELTGTVLAVRATTALVVCGPAVLLPGVLGFPGRAQALAPILIVCWLPMLLTNSYFWTFRGRERMDYEALVNVALKTSGLVVTLGLLKAGLRLTGVIAAQAFAGAVAFWFARKLYA